MNTYIVVIVRRCKILNAALPKIPITFQPEIIILTSAPPQPQPPPPYPPPQTPTIHDNRKHSSHCGILVKSPNEPPMPWRVRPRSVSSLCPCHLDLDPPPRHTPRPPRSTTTANNRRTAETPSNLQMNLRCHGVFARAACRLSAPVA